MKLDLQSISSIWKITMSNKSIRTKTVIMFPLSFVIIFWIFWECPFPAEIKLVYMNCFLWSLIVLIIAIIEEFINYKNETAIVSWISHDGRKQIGPKWITKEVGNRFYKKATKQEIIDYKLKKENDEWFRIRKQERINHARPQT